MASVCSSFCQNNITMDNNSSKNALEDCICPICMCILIEPVTMPCQHELCMPCFKKNVEEASLTCPMCRTRISVWARQAARTRTLVNEIRWQQIRSLFPVKVQRRLEGKDDDSSEEVFHAPKPQLAEPGEIRKEYEDQMRKLREQYEKERQREAEASQRLIRELQAEEDRKAAKLKDNQKALEEHDRELAEELDNVINEAGTDVPFGFLMQESQSRLTRSSSVNSNSGKTQERTLDGYLNGLRPNSQRKSSDPYPFACLTPSQKAGSSSQRASTGISSLFGDKTYVRPDTITVSSSSSLQEIFTPVSSVHPVSRASNSEKPGSSVPSSNVPDAHTGNSLLENILQSESPVPHTSNCHRRKNANDQKRCQSTESNDSISPEISHFKPIQSCPLTPPRRVNGKVIEAPVIISTPRNLSKMGMSPGSHSHGLNFIERSPVMKRRLLVLEEDRKRNIEAHSKSTSTDSNKLLNKKPLPGFHKVPTLVISPVKATKAPCTISSQTQLDENCNESPGSSGMGKQKLRKMSGHAANVSLEGESSKGKPLIPLISCIDELDELDGSPPLPETYHHPSRITFSPSSSAAGKSSPQQVSRALFSGKQRSEKSKKSKGKGKKQVVNNSLLKSPQMSVTDFFQRAASTEFKTQIDSPNFNSASSTPSVDGLSGQVRSLIDKAISSLEEDNAANMTADTSLNLSPSQSSFIPPLQSPQERSKADVLKGKSKGKSTSLKRSRLTKNLKGKANQTLDKFLMGDTTVNHANLPEKRLLSEPTSVGKDSMTLDCEPLTKTDSQEQNSKYSKSYSYKSPVKNNHTYKSPPKGRKVLKDPTFYPSESDNESNKSPPKGRKVLKDPTFYPSESDNESTEETDVLLSHRLRKKPVGRLQSDSTPSKSSPPRRSSRRKRRNPVYFDEGDSEEDSDNKNNQTLTSSPSNLGDKSLNEPVSPIKTDYLTRSPLKKSKVENNIKTTPKKDNVILVKNDLNTQNRSKHSPRKAQRKSVKKQVSSVPRTHQQNPSNNYSKNLTESVDMTLEERDRQLALELQKQFDIEARQETQVNRRKGSSDEYSLRRRRNQPFSPVASHTRTRKSTL